MNINTENYLKSCRICLHVEKSPKFVNIFTTQMAVSSIFSIADALQILVNEQLVFDTNDNHLPHFICLDCFKGVKKAYKKVQQIICSANTLENYKRNRIQTEKTRIEDAEENSMEFVVDYEEEKYEVTNEVITEEKYEMINEENTMEDKYEIINEENSMEEKYEMINGENTTEDHFSALNDPDYIEEEDVEEEDNIEYVLSDKEEKTGDGDYYVVEEIKVEDTEPEDRIDLSTDAISFLFDNVIPEKRKSHSKQRKSHSQQGRNRKCEVCEKTFVRKSNLVDHLRLHANVKLFSCEICQKSFVQAGNLKIHMRTHTQDKPFACEVCGNKYSQSSALKTHMKSHTNTKDFVCIMCGKGFTNSSDMKKHSLIHSDIKNFQCLVCPNKFFTQKIHLKNHLKKQHSDENLEELLEQGCLKKTTSKQDII